MEKTDRGAMAGKIALPLAQTVFLPKTAMGVRYIENIRTTVYAEKVTQQQRERCLRGFYELDMEYRGLEGRRLYKHRVMLPLRADLPAGWLPGVRCEVSDMHIVIGTPQIQILSPYVLEFSGRLWLEYIGSSAEEQPARPEPKPYVRHWSSDIPPVLQDEAAKRLESKIDRMFFREMGDGGERYGAPEGRGAGMAKIVEEKPAENLAAEERWVENERWAAKEKMAENKRFTANESCAEDAVVQDAADERAFRLPVWRRGARLPQRRVMRPASAEHDRAGLDMKARYDMNEDTVLGMSGAEGSCDERPGGGRMQLEHRIRSIFSRRQVDACDTCYQEVDMPAKPQAMREAAAEEDESESGYGLPVWRKLGDAQQMTAARKMGSSYGVAALRDKILGRLEQDNDYAAPGVFKTGREAERPKAAENLPAQEPNKGKLRSMLTAAAIARLQAQGEKLRMVDLPQNDRAVEETAGALLGVQEVTAAVSNNASDKMRHGGREEMRDAVPVAGAIGVSAELREPVDSLAGSVIVAPVVRDEVASVQETVREAVPKMMQETVPKIVQESVRESGWMSTANEVARPEIAVQETGARDIMAQEGRGQENAVPEVVTGKAEMENVGIENVVAAELMAGNARETAAEAIKEGIKDNLKESVKDNVREVVRKDAGGGMIDGMKVAVRETVADVVAENMNENMAENTNERIGQDVAGEAAVAQMDGDAPLTSMDVVAEVSVAEVSAAEPVQQVMPVIAAESEAATAAESVGEPGGVLAANVEVVQTAAGQNTTEQDAAGETGQVRLVNTNGVRLRMNTGARQSMAMPGISSKSGGCSLKYYVVKPGDDPMGIALKHNVSLESLRAGNRLPDGELTAGMVLRIPC